MNEQPTLFFITGPIGVGKSTCVASLLKRISATGIDFISSDLYYYLYFMNINDLEKNNYKKAKALRDYKINKAITQHKSFIWESVFDDKKISMIDSFSKQDYQIFGIFIGTDNLNSLINRVKHRASEDWYNIPEEKIKDRYTMMMGGLKRLYLISQIFIGVDSNDEGFKLVFFKKYDDMQLVDKNCLWLKQFLLKNNILYSTQTNIIENQEEKYHV